MKYQQFGKMQKPIPPGKLVFAFIFFIFFFSEKSTIESLFVLTSYLFEFNFKGWSER